MAVTSFNNLLAEIDDIKLPGHSGTEQNQNSAKRPAAKFWVNVGIKRGGKMLTLPMGIALDNLQAKPLPKQRGEFYHLREAEAQLWEKIQALMATLKPGESKTLPFEVEIRRVEEKQDSPESQENPFALGDIKL